MKPPTHLEALPGRLYACGERMTASIGKSLTLLAQVAGVPLRGLDDEQLDIVALRLVIGCDDQPVFTCIGRIVDEVRQADGVAERRIEAERQDLRRVPST